MKKITKQIIEKYFKENTTVLSPTQQALCVPIINRIYKKMLNGVKFDDIKICKDLVIDGHHRYVSALLAGEENWKRANKSNFCNKPIQLEGC